MCKHIRLIDSASRRESAVGGEGLSQPMNADLPMLRITSDGLKMADGCFWNPRTLVECEAMSEIKV